jgi:mRNA-degrading endonuclease toxin of MazEF toxin-antitoxin module
MIELSRGDVVLVAFPFFAQGAQRRKRRPAVVVQADRYNRRRAALTLAAVTSAQVHRDLPCKVPVAKNSPAGRAARLRMDSVIDCQTIVTVPREEIVRRLGSLPADTMRKVDSALQDALGLTASRAPAR